MPARRRAAAHGRVAATGRCRSWWRPRAGAAVPAGGSVALGIACSCGSAAGFATVNLWGRTLADVVGERLDATGVAGLVTVLLGIAVSAVPARAPGAARLRRHAPRRPRVR